ncbi:MAG: DinB family protein [Candidatus Promineifilaceae bacterium]
MNLDSIATALEQFPAVLHALLDNQPEALLRQRPAQQEWSILEVIGHLIEADRDAFRTRVERIAIGVPEIVPVSPTAPIKEKEYRNWAYTTLMAAFKAQRKVSAEFIRSLKTDDLAKTANHTEYGTFTAGDFIAEWPYHDMEHLSQIADNLQQPYPSMMSVTMRRALDLN